MALLGILCEAAATNLCLQSQTFDNASWTKSNITVSADQVASPDGTTTADKITATIGGSVATLVSAAMTVSASTTYTYSVYVKAGSGTTIQLRMSDTVTGQALATFTPSAGSVGAVSAGTYSNASSSTVSVGNGWYRFTLTATQPAGQTLMIVGLYIAGNTDYIYAWGAQLELGSSATSYIPTTTTAVARNADLLTYTGGDIANLKTLAATFQRAVGVSNTGLIAELNDGTSNNIATMYLGDATTTRWQGNVGGSIGTWNPPGKTYTAGSVSKVSQSWATNDFKGDLNGTACTPDTSTGVPTLTQLNVGHQLGSFVLNGHVGHIYGWTRNLSQSELGAIDR